jgi:acetylornithine deacetylase
LNPAARAAASYNGPVLTARESDVLNRIDPTALLADLRDLIRHRSLGGQEDSVQRWMAARMRRLGLDVDMWEIDFAALAAHPSFSMEVPRDRGLGVVGTCGTGDGPVLIFNGHVDVVPIGDAAQWTVDPWDATVRDGVVLGRGACDMKGGLAAALAALTAIVGARVPLGGRVALHSVVAEEDGGAGTLAAIVRGHRGDGALSMEPTERKLAPAHGGALTFRIRVPGRSAHGCVREEGVSAIETFRPVHDALLALERERNRRLRQPLFDRYALPFALSIGRVQAGDWPSSVPDLLICEGRYGVAPGERAADARHEFEAAVAGAAGRHPYLREHPPAVEWWGGQFMPARTADDAAVVRTTAAAIADVTGAPPAIEGMPYGADMRLLVNDAGIPTVLFGPGDVRKAHQPDESVPLDDLLIVARTLALIALRFCA